MRANSNFVICNDGPSSAAARKDSQPIGKNLINARRGKPKDTVEGRTQQRFRETTFSPSSDALRFASATRNSRTWKGLWQVTLQEMHCLGQPVSIDRPPFVSFHFTHSQSIVSPMRRCRKKKIGCIRLAWIHLGCLLAICSPIFVSGTLGRPM
ncbi:putative transmembrane protein [Toxoplasma gondii RUB]|uniref:Putative transmembrane protein n=3 Tax=Toxoplasma gondii TaxID=5811 RepID=A0A086M4C0_TOXGO|nr:putative transmembrane protein [Toxoplasma gondii p89]KFG63738.1 putative transmembrane protein [Toxoplasma gondii RUB]KFH11196.1 putative transmembrane protein [Toxoplasma gondii VAND]